VDARAVRRGRALGEAGERVLVVDGTVGPGAVDRRLWRPGMLVLATRGEAHAAPWPEDLPLHLHLPCGDPAAAAQVRAAVGEALRVRRGLPPAGPVGGPAALDDRELAALLRLASAADTAPA
jgi:hypothetical protein